MKKNISINLQGLIFHIEEDGYDVLFRYLGEVKAHFARFQGQAEIVADIESRIAELFSARLSATQQVITLADVEAMIAKMGRVSDFATEDDDEEIASAAGAGTFGPDGPFGPKGTFGPEGTFGPDGPFGPKGPFGPGDAAAGDGPRRLYRDMTHRKIAGVAAGLAQYFRVNPVWIRLGFIGLLLIRPLLYVLFDDDQPFFHYRGFGFDGLSALLYVVLWVLLPKQYDAPAPIDTLEGPWSDRKLFRDTANGSIGGVAAGLAAYFRLDVTVVRILLIISLIPLAVAPVLLAYVILWIVVPEAHTPSERLRMRGDAVTLSGIASNVQDDSPAGPAPGGRPVGTFVEGAARTLRPAVSFVGTLVRWLIGSLLVLLGLSALIPIAALLGAVLGLVSADGVLHLDGIKPDSLLANAPTWGVVMGALATGIPALALMLLGLRLFLRHSLLSRTASLSLLGLWIVGLIGTGIAAGQIANQFRSQGSSLSTRSFRPGPARVTLLTVADGDDFFGQPDLTLAAADSGQDIRIEQEITARGSSRADASRTAAAGVDYEIAQRDTALAFDEGIRLHPGTPFRGQNLKLTLHLPLGRTYRLSERFADRLPEEFFYQHRRPEHAVERRCRLRLDGLLECLDCTADDLRRDADDDADDAVEEASRAADAARDEAEKASLNIDNGGMELSLPSAFNTDPAHYGTSRKSLPDATGFTQVEASGNYRLLLRPGSSYRVEAAGREADLRDLRFKIESGRLVVERRDKDSFLPSLNFNDHAVLVRITLPQLRGLDLSGACRADAAGFREALTVEQSGACASRLDVNVPRLDLDLSGACQADLRGRATTLSVDASGACKVRALALQTERTDLDLDGVSKASVAVRDHLSADLSGSCKAEYRGQPRVSQDLSGASRLRQL